MEENISVLLYVYSHYFDISFYSMFKLQNWIKSKCDSLYGNHQLLKSLVCLFKVIIKDGFISQPGECGDDVCIKDLLNMYGKLAFFNDKIVIGSISLRIVPRANMHWHWYKMQHYYGQSLVSMV